MLVQTRQSVNGELCMKANSETGINNSEFEAIDTFQPLLKAISAPASGSGLLVAVDTARRCIGAADEVMPSPRAKEWLAQCNLLYQAIEEHCKTNPSYAVVAAKEETRPVYSVFASPAKCATTPPRQQRVDAMMGVALCVAVSQGAVITNSFAEHWQTVRRACSGGGKRDSDWELIAEKLPLHNSELIELAKIAQHPGVQKFITDLLRMVLVELAAVPSPDPCHDTSPELDGKTSNNEDEEDEEDEDPTEQYGEKDPRLSALEKQGPKEGSIIEWQLTKATFAPLADKVGLLIAANRMPPADLKLVCQNLLVALETDSDTNQRFAYAAFLSLFCSLPIKILLTVSSLSNEDIYVDVERQQITWNYRKVLDQDKKSATSPSHVHQKRLDVLEAHIPQPILIGTFGKTLLSGRPDASTIEELLDVPEDKTQRRAWIKQYGLFLRTCGDLVYPPYSTRFSNSIAPVYLQESRQDLVAANQGFGLAGAASGMLHYVNFDREQITFHANQVYNFLGLGPAAPLPLDFTSYGSGHAPAAEVFVKGWNELMCQFEVSLHRAKDASTDDEFISSFNEVITFDLTAVVTLLGHRAQRIERLTIGSLYSNKKAVYTADKDTEAGSTSRLVPKTQLLLEVLWKHQSNLKILARQAISRGLTCPLIEELAAGVIRFKRSAFFHLKLKATKNGPKKVSRIRCSAGDIEKTTERFFGKPKNCGRHFWVTEGCRRNWNRWLLRVLTGHARQDAEAFHEFGLVAPDRALDDLGALIEQLTKELGMHGPKKVPASASGHIALEQFQAVPLFRPTINDEVRKPKSEGGQITHQRNLFTTSSLPSIAFIDSVRELLIKIPGSLAPAGGLLMHLACIDGVTNSNDLRQIFFDIKNQLLNNNGKPMVCFDRHHSSQEIALPIQHPTRLYLKLFAPDIAQITWDDAAHETARWLKQAFQYIVWPVSADACIESLLRCLTHWTNFYLPPAFNSAYAPQTCAATFSRFSIQRLSWMDARVDEINFPIWTPHPDEYYREKNQSLDLALKCLNSKADTTKELGKNLARAKLLQKDLETLESSFTDGAADVVKRIVIHEVTKIIQVTSDRLELSSLATYFSALRPTLQSIPAYENLRDFQPEDWQAFYNSATHVKSQNKPQLNGSDSLSSLKEDRIAAAKRCLKCLYELGFNIPQHLVLPSSRAKTADGDRRAAASVLIKNKDVEVIEQLIRSRLGDWPLHTARAILKLNLLAAEVPLRYGSSSTLPINCLTSAGGCLVIRDEGFSNSKGRRHQVVEMSEEAKKQIGSLAKMLIAADRNSRFLFLSKASVHDTSSDGWLHDLLTELLQRVTGDSTARTHGFRGRVFSERVFPEWENIARQLLDGRAGPELSQKFFSLCEPLWTSFAQSAFEAGHTNRFTGGVYYWACWPLLRAAAMSSTLVRTTPPTDMTQRLGFSNGAMRKARQRADIKDAPFDSWVWLCSSLKFEHWKPFEAKNQIAVPTVKEADAPHHLPVVTFDHATIYVARRLLYQEKTAAQTRLVLPTSLVATLEDKLPNFEEVQVLTKRINGKHDGRAIAADLEALSSSDAKIFFSDRSDKPLPDDAALLALLTSSTPSLPGLWENATTAANLLKKGLQSLPKNLSIEVCFAQRHMDAGVAAAISSHTRIVVRKPQRDIGANPRVCVIYDDAEQRNDVSKARLTTLIRILLKSALVVFESINKGE